MSIGGTWNTTVQFGMGKQRGASVTGFHRGASNQGVFSGVVYRGDTRGPEDDWRATFSDDKSYKGLFNQGFELHQSGVTISGRVTSNIAQVHEGKGTTRGVVSATTSVKMAAYWAVHNEKGEGWVYCFYVENEPWAADASMNLMGTEGQAAADVQREIMFRSLPGARIYAARQVKRIGSGGPKQTYLVGKLVPNPGYRGTNPYGLAYNDPDFKIFIDAGAQVLCE